MANQPRPPLETEHFLDSIRDQTLDDSGFENQEFEADFIDAIQMDSIQEEE